MRLQSNGRLNARHVTRWQQTRSGRVSWCARRRSFPPRKPRFEGHLQRFASTHNKACVSRRRRCNCFAQRRNMEFSTAHELHKPNHIAVNFISSPVDYRRASESNLYSTSYTPCRPSGCYSCGRQGVNSAAPHAHGVAEGRTRHGCSDGEGEGGGRGGVRVAGSSAGILMRHMSHASMQQHEVAGCNRQGHPTRVCFCKRLRHPSLQHDVSASALEPSRDCLLV